MRRLALHLLGIIDGMWFALRRLKSGRRATTAGAGVHQVEECLMRQVEGIDWPQFPDLAHSFWRAQEVTLFRRHQHLFSTPCLDLGCGDFAFGQLAGFPAERVGVDFDADSLWAAESSGKAGSRVRADAGRLPLRDRTFAVCVSNSVMEHLPDLDRCCAEVYRVLRPDGYFILTFTLGEFCRQLKELGGQSDSLRWKELFGIHQEPGEDALIKIIERTGFVVVSRVSYQPIETTAIYRFLSSPAVQFIERRLSPRMRASGEARLSPKVAVSIDSTVNGTGACVFVVARRPA